MLPLRATEPSQTRLASWFPRGYGPCWLIGARLTQTGASLAAKYEAGRYRSVAVQGGWRQLLKALVIGEGAFSNWRGQGAGNSC